MSQRGGGVKTERKVTGNIFFDEKAAEILCKFLIDKIIPYDLCEPYTACDRRVLDACCGDGALGNHLWDCGNVDYVDINPMSKVSDYKLNLIDILEWKPKYKYDLIICNPPWSPVEKAEAIYHHLLTILKSWGYLIFIINYAFINTNWQRGERLGRGKTIFLPRYTFAKSLKKFNPESSGLLDPVVMINRRNKNDAPFFCNIPPEICKTKQLVLSQYNYTIIWR